MFSPQGEKLSWLDKRGSGSWLQRPVPSWHRGMVFGLAIGLKMKHIILEMVRMRHPQTPPPVSGVNEISFWLLVNS